MPRETTKILLLISAVLLSGCEPEPAAPDEVYRAYVSRSANGMSFEQELEFWSVQKVEELEARLQSLMERSQRSREEAIQLYMDISRRTAECTSLELETEEISAASAKLVFSATDTCGDAQTARHHVRLVLEDEWKLDEVEITM